MSSLRTYEKKRDFKATAEPKGGKRGRAAGSHIFVIQRHHASRLHYDFRLEVDGVLKSWAVPKGPSMNPADKRLAMQVEDHPYDYKDFEGVIPAGNYGAGYVYIWDKGTYELLDGHQKSFDREANAEIHAGNLKVRLKGRKVKGEFALVKMKGSEDNAWLLLKHKDEYASKGAYNSEDYTPERVKEKGEREKEKMRGGKKKARPVKEAATAAAPEKPAKRKAARMKEVYVPMMATLVDAPFSREGWLFETKWDGYRAIAAVEKGKVALYSRNQQSFNKDYPAVAAAVGKIPHNVVLDGEIVVLEKNGTSDFQSLQNYRSTGKGNLVYAVFDLLHLDGVELQQMPLVQRKELLQEIVAQLNSKTVVYSDHVLTEGEKLYKEAGKAGWEGIIAKETEGVYVEGRRTTSWLKMKIVDEQEAIICGYTEPRGSRKKIGALILALYEDRKLKYIGHCGGGLNESLINTLYKAMQPLKQKASPFSEKIKTNMPVTWVKPVLVCQVKFSSWTEGGHLRQPVILGLREDKAAKDVHKETAKTIAMAATKKAPPAQEKERTLKLNGKQVTLTNQQKVFWPDEQITKGDLIDYYLSMADYILPHLKDRPLSLHRFPNGIKGPGFYQKDLERENTPAWVKTVPLYSTSNQKDVDYLVCNNEATLAYMINLGCIEVNPWLSRLRNLEMPDYLVLDLDPENIAFRYVVETALCIKEILDKLSVTSYCKTSGASGLHIYVPTGAKYDYESCRLFAEYIANQAHRQLPRTTSVTRAKAQRNKKVYIDYLQNSRGQTVAAPYSIRPKPGATAAAPLLWKELNDDLAISDFTIHNMKDRIQDVGDLWKDVQGTKNDLRRAIREIEAAEKAAE